MEESTKDIAVWVGSISNLLLDTKTLSSAVTNVMSKFVVHVTSSQRKFALSKSTPLVQEVLDALLSLPFKQMDKGCLTVAKVFLVVLGTALARGSSSTFIKCLNVLVKYMSIESFEFICGPIVKWFTLLFKNWTKAYLESCVMNMSVPRSDFIDVAPQLIVAEFDSGECIILLCSDEFATAHLEEKIIKASSFFKSPLWNAIADNIADTQLEQIEQKMIDPIMDEFDLKSCTGVEGNERLELLSFVFTIFSNMNRAQRTKILPHLFSSKQRKKLCKASLAILDGTQYVSEASKKIVIEKAFDFYFNTARTFELEDFTLEKLYDWNVLVRVHYADPSLVGLISSRCTPQKLVEFIKTYSDIEEEMRVIPMLATFVNQSLAEHVNDITEPICELLAREPVDQYVLPFLVNIVKLSSTSKTERTIVSLALGILSTLTIKPEDIKLMLLIDNLLINCIKFCHSSVTQDQCALYIQIVIKHFKNVQVVSQNKYGIPEERDRLVYGCAKIAQQIASHEKYFGRIIAMLISETIVMSNHIELAMCRIHTISDKFSNAMLATALPPVEKRRYSWVFPTIRKSLKRVV